MERTIELNEIILLMATYSIEGQRLHASLKRAGCDCLALVLEENNFLPEDVASVNDLLLGYFKAKKDNIAKPKYFNEIPVPDGWNISAGNEKLGRIYYQGEEKGKIYYLQAIKRHVVEAVDWYDRTGSVRFRDHYNRYGAVCARTVYDNKGKPISKTWFSKAGQEIIMENYVTGDIILNDGDMIKFFRTKRELTRYFFDKIGIGQKRIFYNSLSAPFMISNRLEGGAQRDILFWQEAIEEEIPWNMRMILNRQTGRTSKVMIQKRESYNRLLKLGAEKDVMQKLGFIYPFEKKNGYMPEALICTNSDRIEHCIEIIEALPRMQFHIAAVTLMSPQLLSLESYDNVSLYPGAGTDVFDELFKRCDYYFDINHRAEIVSAVYKAFLHNHLIVSFQETVHSREYVADAHIYPSAEYDKMVSDVREIMEDRNVMKQHLKQQLEHAMAESKETYIKMLECNIP